MTENAKCSGSLRPSIEAVTYLTDTEMRVRPGDSIADRMQGPRFKCPECGSVRFPRRSDGLFPSHAPSKWNGRKVIEQP